MEILASRRFTKSYLRSSVPLQALTEHAIHDFLRMVAADPRRVRGEYDQLAGFGGKVLKLDVSGGHRLLVNWEPPHLVLLDVGDHGILKRYKAQHLAEDLSVLSAAPRQFALVDEPGFFVTAPDAHFSVFGPELTAGWLYFLSDQQLDALYQLLAEAISSLEGGTRTVLLIGGPGTGKTSILLNLLKWLVDFELSARIELSDDLAEYVAASAALDLGPYRTCEDPHVVLVDDPGSAYEIRSSAAHRYGEKLTVIAFDPCQLHDALADAEFDRITAQTGASVLRLNVSYRQKANVGAATKHAADLIAKSTPFLREDRQLEYAAKYAALTEFANELVFPNPHGYVQVYTRPSSKDLATELARIRSVPMWKHWPPILAVVDERVTVPQTWTEQLEQIGARVVRLGEIHRIKGLEYQHVLLMINEDLYSQVDKGFRGSGRAEYLQRRLLRIPFSRAKDSLVTFVAPATAQTEGLDR